MQVSGLTGVAAVTGGWNHSLAVQPDGTLWAWGENFRGQLGNGTAWSTTPVQSLISLRVTTPIVTIADVSNATELAAALADQQITTINFEDDITMDVTANRLIDLNLSTFTLTGGVSFTTTAAGSMSLTGTGDPGIDGDLTINAPNASIDNSLKVSGEVIILDVSSSTWTENADGNCLVINIQNPGTSRVLIEGHVVKLTVNGSGDGLDIEIEGSVGTAVFNAPADVTGADNIATVDIASDGVVLDQAPGQIAYAVNFGVRAGSGILSAEVNGTAISTGDTVSAGQNVVFTAAPLDDYQLKDWFVNGIAQGSTSDTYTATNLQARLEVEVKFEPMDSPTTYSVTFGVRDGLGSLSAVAGVQSILTGTQVEAGTTVVFTATPGENNQILNWYQDRESLDLTATTYTIENLQSNVEVEVAFEAISVASVTTAQELAAALANPAITTIHLEANITLADVSMERLISLHLGQYTLTGDVTLTTDQTGVVNFTGTADPGIHGDLTVNAPNATIANHVKVSGEVVILDVAGSTWTEYAMGNHLVIDIQSQGLSRVIIRGTVASLVITASGDGLDIIIDEEGSVGTATFHAPADVTGARRIDSVHIAASGVTLDEAPDSVAFAVVFAVRTGAGSLSAWVDGTPISSGQTVAAGRDVSFTAVPAHGYQLSDWFVNGVAQSLTVETYTASDLQAPLCVQVSFAPIVPAEDAPAAPAVANRILQQFQLGHLFLTGQHHRNGRAIYGNYISEVARMMRGTAFMGVSKENTAAYYQAVYNFLKSLGADLP